MADDPHVIRRVSWSEIFSFTHLFKTFKMAIQPTKLTMALAGILLVCLVGTLMDALWTGLSDSNRVMQGEAWGYWTLPSRAALVEAKRAWLDKGRFEALDSFSGGGGGSSPGRSNMVGYGTPGASLASNPDRGNSRFHTLLNDQRIKNNQQYSEASARIEGDFKDGVRNVQKQTDLTAAQKDQRIADLQRTRQTDLVHASQKLAEGLWNLSAIQGGGIGKGLFQWECACAHNALASLGRGDFLGGVAGLLNQRGHMIAPADLAPMGNVPPSDGKIAGEQTGLIGWVMLMAWGVFWLVSIYPIYAAIFLLASLAIWSLFGGAICRMAALHAAREDKIGITASLRFARGKFFSFFAAPLLPIALIVLLGLVLSLVGLVGNVPVIGEWLLSILMFLPLIVGAICAFLIIGLGGGWPLMWPTVAVEGSDSFDSISRPFNYIYFRPMAYSVYWLVTAVYGALCYLFVRLFAYIALLTTHHWLGWAMKLSHRPEFAVGAGKLDVMWPTPTFGRFLFTIPTNLLSGSEAGAARLISFWVFLAEAMVLAFAICFFFSASTIMYFLLRRKVDATDLDDVYAEEVEPELPPTPAVPTQGQTASEAQTAPPVQSSPSGESPQADPPPPGPASSCEE